MRARSIVVLIGFALTSLVACEAILDIADATTERELADGATTPADARTGVDVVSNGSDADTSSSGSICDESDAYFLCDDFEHDLTPYKIDIIGDGGLSIEDAAARFGKGGLLAQIGSRGGGQPATAFLGRDVTLPASYVIRLFAKLEQQPVSSGFGLLYLYDDQESATELRVELGAPSLVLSRTDAGTGTASVPFPVGQWVCIEWSVSPGAMTIRQDGLRVLDTTFAPNMGSNFQIGLRASNEPPARIEIDELVMAADSPGCDR